MTESIIDISHSFFEEIVLPILTTHFPDETAVTAFGVFGHGSEALRLDDEYSSDHHWGLRWGLPERTPTNVSERPRTLT